MSITAATLYTTPSQPVETQAFTVWIVFFTTNILFAIPWVVAALWFKQWLMQETRLVILNKVMSILLVITLIASYKEQKMIDWGNFISLFIFLGIMTLAPGNNNVITFIYTLRFGLKLHLCFDLVVC